MLWMRSRLGVHSRGIAGTGARCGVLLVVNMLATSSLLSGDSSRLQLYSVDSRHRAYLESQRSSRYYLPPGRTVLYCSSQHRVSRRPLTVRNVQLSTFSHA